MTVFETERLRLRHLRADDVDGVLEIFSDPEAMRHAPEGVRDRDFVVEWLARVERLRELHGVGFWAAELKSDGKYAGHAGLLTQEVDGVVELEIAYWFQRRHWGQGLATEAACGCRDYAWRELGRRRLISLVAPGNTGSRRVAEKVGMTLEKETEWRGHAVRVFSIHAGG